MSPDPFVGLLGTRLVGSGHKTIDLIHEREIVRLRHSLPDGKLQKEGRALCFTAGLLWTMAKGNEYSKDSHDTEAILAQYRVDKPSKRFYQL